MAARKPLQIEVITHVAGSMQHCSHCQIFIDGAGIGGKVHRDNLSSYPPEFMAEWQQLSDWVLDLAAAHPGQLVIKITDAQTLPAMWKALTQGVRRYPTFIIDGHEKYHGWDREELERCLLPYLADVQS
jgi:hypothetical protein